MNTDHFHTHLHFFLIVGILAVLKIEKLNENDYNDDCNEKARMKKEC